MKTKTFMDFLKEQENDEMIYVGTKDGAGWIVIERAETLIQKMEKLESYLHGKASDTYKNAVDNLRKLPSFIVEDQKKIDILEADAEDKKEELRKAKGLLSDHERKYVSSYMTRKKYSNVLKSWKRVDERKVIETYEHNTDKIGTCVLLEGFENGELWYFGEKEVI